MSTAVRRDDRARAAAPRQDPPSHPVASGNEREAQHFRLTALLQGLPPPDRSADGRLPQLVQRFGLDPLEADVLALLWVGAFDPALRAEAVSREPYSGQITVRVVASLYGHPPRVRLNSESPLRLWQMVQEHALIDGSAALEIDPAILAWLEGGDELDHRLAGRVELCEPGLESPCWPLDATAGRIRDGWPRGVRWRVWLHTDDARAARWCAVAIARRLGLPVLGASPALSGEPDAALRLHRQAYLDGSAPCVAAESAALLMPAGVPPCPLLFVHGAGSSSTTDGVQVLELALPPPDADERLRLWSTLWPEARTWPPHELSELALCHEAGVADIAAVAASAPDSAATATQRLRERGRDELAMLAQRIDASFGWDDLVLPEATHARLREIAFEARERARVWSAPAAARLFPYGRALVALFSGPPGTGKTMAAQVIAADLGLDLLAVDLSAVVSKWVGETAQHLQQMLGSRAARRSVLFFDEADALYAKRVDEVRDAQDRYANLDTSHLMTALERYPGIVLLASNLKANIDSAFLRRIRHVVDFPKPAVDARARIWLRVLTALFGAATTARMRRDVDAVAQIEATGAVIKHAALSALFAARQSGCEPDARLLGGMLARELAKEGKGLSVRQIDALQGSGP